MMYESFNRRLAFLAGIFSFFGFFLGVVAIVTNYWTYLVTYSRIPTDNNTTELVENGTIWNGLFYTCTDLRCNVQFYPQAFVIFVIGLLFLLTGGVLSIIDFPKEAERRFVTPLSILISCILITAGLFDYGSMQLLNYHSSRLMISGLVFAYAALPISAFVSGRYSVAERTVLINNETHESPKKFTPTESSNGL